MKKLVFTEEKQKRLLNVSLGLNIFIVILVGIAVGVLFGNANPFPVNPEETTLDHLKYFTVLSNILMAFCAIAIIIAISLKKTRRIAHIGKPTYFVGLVGTASVTLTMLVTVFFLIPLSYYVNEEYYNARILAGGSNLIMHILVPLVSIISFICFLKTGGNITYSETLFSLIPVFAYAIFYVYMAYSHVNPQTGKPDPAYDWYWFCQFGWYYVPVVIIGIIGLMLLVNFLLWAGNKRIYVNKRVWELSFNFMIILFGIGGLIWSFFTKDIFNDGAWLCSQGAWLLTLITIAYIVVYFLVRAKKLYQMPNWLRVLKLTGVSVAGLTLFGSLFYVIPVFGWQALQTSQIFYRLFLPVFALTSYVLLEHTSRMRVKHIWWTMVPLTIYICYYLGTAFTHQVEPWVFEPGYDWYQILSSLTNAFPWVIISALAFNYFVGWSLYLSNHSIKLDPPAK